MDTVKFLADGGLSGATAALSVPYRHADDARLLRLREQRAAGAVPRGARRRLAHRHPCDRRRRDRPGARHLRSARPAPRAACAHRIEHFGLPNAAQLARAARLRRHRRAADDLPPQLGPQLPLYLPDSLLPRAYPVRAMLDARRPVALSSDAPVVENDNPLVGMQAAVTAARRRRASRSRRRRRSPPAEALHAYTMGGAVATGRQGQPRQPSRPGTWADLAVLSANPLATLARDADRGQGGADAGSAGRSACSSGDGTADVYQQHIGGEWARRRRRRHVGRHQSRRPRRSSRPCRSAAAADCDARDRRRRERRSPAGRGRTPYERGAILDSAPPLHPRARRRPRAHHGARERQAAGAGARRVAGGRRPASSGSPRRASAPTAGRSRRASPRKRLTSCKQPIGVVG